MQDFIFFIVVVVIYAIIVTLHELAAERGFVDTLIVIVGHISSFIPVAIVLAFIFEIGGTLIMMLWRMYMRQQEAQIEQARVEAKAEGRNEGKAEGRNEGKAEGRNEGKAEGRNEGIAEGRTEGRTEGIAEGRTEGRAEAYQLWSAWNTRRIEAEAQNLPFDEPPPPPPEAAPK